MRDDRESIVQELRYVLQSQKQELELIQKHSIQITQFGGLLLAATSALVVNNPMCELVMFYGALFSFTILLILAMVTLNFSPYIYHADAGEIIRQWIRGEKTAEISKVILMKYVEFEIKWNYPKMARKHKLFKVLQAAFVFEVIFSIITLQKIFFFC